VQRFAEALGARTARDRELTIPPAASVIVLSAWYWDLSIARRERLERWVDSGGRLVVDETLTGSLDEFERWSGIVMKYRALNDAKTSTGSQDEEECRPFHEEQYGTPSNDSESTDYSMCDLDDVSSLTSKRNALWTLRNGSGIQAMRVQVGRGSVTVINAAPFGYRSLFRGDHGRLFVAATQLRPADDVHFLSEDDHASLLALVWQHGAPVVMISLALLTVVLWRGGVRFGPLTAPADEARRSLAEQIRGTGQFALLHGGGDSLHAASVRALDEAAVRRIPGYSRLSADERGGALARLTGFDSNALVAAVHHGGVRRSPDLRNTIALIEVARRQLLIDHARLSHGTH
jgi:hypothetical protein